MAKHIAQREPCPGASLTGLPLSRYTVQPYDTLETVRQLILGPPRSTVINCTRVQFKPYWCS